jgi:hypothetical protein
MIMVFLFAILGEASPGDLPPLCSNRFTRRKKRPSHVYLTNTVQVGRSGEELADWTNRMLIVLGEQPLEPLPPGAGVRPMNFGRKRSEHPQRPPDPPPVSRFLGLVPVDEPDRPLTYGGRIQILGVELYNDKVSVNWRLAPLPDPEALFAAELAEQVPDLEGLSDDFKKILRGKLINRLQMQKRSLALSDDIGADSEEPAVARVEAAMKGVDTLTSPLGCRGWRNG